MVRVAVIGAGIVGLSTAVRIQEILPHVTVAVIADRFGQDTTSDGAAGFFRPTLDLVQGVHEDTVRTWVMDSWNHFDEIAKSSESADAGVWFLSGYHLYDTGVAYVRKPDVLQEVVYHYRDMVDREHEMFGCRRRENGVFFTSLMIEARWHLPWLTKKFQKNGGKIVIRTVKSLDEMAGNYDVVVNCTGLRAKDLLPEEKLLEPNRGQVLRVKAPWIKHFIYVDMNCWIIPGKEWVVIGGTRQANNSNTEINQKDLDDVWNRACEVVPSLKDAQVMKIWPGLRPYRSPLRLELENRNVNGKTLKVVHNYGHGGNGIGLSWGTAVNAAKLVQEAIYNKSKL